MRNKLSAPLTAQVVVVFQVFPPALSDLPPPMLDLFDLDETFSSEKVRLAQITNKCKFLILLSGTIMKCLGW